MDGGTLFGVGAIEGSAQSIFDFTALQYGEPVALDKFRGQALVIVNVASA